MAKKSKEDIRFEIDQLRKEKMIYMAESSALTLVSILVYFYAPVLFRDYLADQGNQKYFIFILGVFFFSAIFFWLYTAASNMRRQRKVKNLEKKL